MKEGLGLTFPPTETSTEQLPGSSYLDSQIEELFTTARDGFWGDEDSKEFTDRLSDLVNLYGDAAIWSLAHFVIGNKVSSELTAETLSCLSHLESGVARNYRLWLMERALQSSSSWTRDAAASSLEAMDDPSAIPYLVEAHTTESNTELRQYLHSVIEYLQRKR